MTIAIAGGCQCGAVRFTGTADPAEAYWCHCRMCQRAVGNVAAAFVNVNKADTTITGPIAHHMSSPIARRGFCAACGTPLTFDYPDSPNMDLTIGALDDPAAFRPTSHFGVESWVEGWIAHDALPVTRSDEHEPLQRRWAAAGGPPA